MGHDVLNDADTIENYSAMVMRTRPNQRASMSLAVGSTQATHTYTKRERETPLAILPPRRRHLSGGKASKVTKQPSEVGWWTHCESLSK